MASFGGWQTLLLKRLGMPVTRQNLAFLTAWQGREGGTAAFNPLNTTQPMPGASAYNSVGVRNFLNAQQGLNATVKTLQNSYYPAILAALRSGNPTWNPLLAKNLSTWGTGSSWMRGYRDTTVPATVGESIATQAVPTTRAVIKRTPAVPGSTFTLRRYNPGQVAQGIFSALASGDLPDVSSLVSSAYTNEQVRIPGIPAQISKSRVRGTIAAKAVPAAAAKGLVATAAKQLGQPYVWGGESRKEGGFDCSGLIDWAARQRGYQGPRLTTYNIAKMGTSVKGKPPQPGDLVISNGGEHVSIYAGNGKVLVAPHTGTVVQWQDIASNVTDIRRVSL